MSNTPKTSGAPKPSQEQLHALLAQDSTNLDKLQTLLEEERQALETRQHDQLPALIEAKTQALDALAETAALRRQWLRAAGMEPNQEHWQKWLQDYPQGADLAKAWQDITQRMDACRQLNEINGKVMGRAQQALGRLLGLLRGQEARTNTQLYDQRGQASGKGDSQTLVKA